MSASTVTDPLTTIFTPPAWCSSVLNSYSSWGDLGGVLHVLQNGYTPGLGTNSICWPTNFYHHNSYATPTDPAIYSPGVCPSGYRAFSNSMSGDATIAACCPSGFSPATGLVGKCTRAAGGPSSTFVAGVGSHSSEVVTSPVQQFAWAIKIAWASSDLDVFTPASAPLLTAVAELTSSQTLPASGAASRSQVGTATSTGTGDGGSQTSTNNSSTPPASTSLSTGAKIGIGVGVGLGCILIVVLVAILVVMMKKRQNNAAAASTSYGQEAWRVRSTSTGASTFSPVQPQVSEADYGRADWRSPYVKPELEAHGYPRNGVQAELSGS